MKRIKSLRSERQPLSMFILAWVELGDAVITIITLGWVQPTWKSYMLFKCAWFEKLEEWEGKL